MEKKKKKKTWQKAFAPFLNAIHLHIMYMVEIGDYSIYMKATRWRESLFLLSLNVRKHSHPTEYTDTVEMLRSGRHVIPSIRGVRVVSSIRYQSSSSGTKVLKDDLKVQEDLLKKKKDMQQQQAKSPKVGTDASQKQKSIFKNSSVGQSIQKHMTDPADKTIQTIRLKKGFSNITRVPATVNLDTRDVLLDKLYQGFNPLLTPIKPKTKKAMPKILVNIYEDLSFDEEGIENESEDLVDSMIGPKLQISKYIYDKNPKVEAKLKELQLDEDKLPEGRKPKATVSFTQRENANKKRGRVRIEYQKKSESDGSED